MKDILDSALLYIKKILNKIPILNRFIPIDLTRDYQRAWIKEEGKTYRISVYERQKKNGSQPLVSNPTFEEIRAALQRHSPKLVLEVGCGWGRILSEIKDEFNVEGCDVSEDMLRLCPPGLKVFQLDVLGLDDEYLNANAGRWDIIFSRGVMLYFMKPHQMKKVIKNLDRLAKKKIIVWEWPEVCDYMKSISSNNKFEYHPIEKNKTL